MKCDCCRPTGIMIRISSTLRMRPRSGFFWRSKRVTNIRSYLNVYLEIFKSFFSSKLSANAKVQREKIAHNIVTNLVQSVLGGQRICLPSQRCGLYPLVGKIPWRRKWQPTPVFLPGKSYRERRLVGCSSWGCKEVHMTWWVNNNKYKFKIKWWMFFNLAGLSSRLCE